MKSGKRIFFSIFWLVLGIVLLVLSIVRHIDPTWSSISGGLIGASLVQLVRHMRYRTNPQYREKMDITMSDERNRYLRMKAMSWAAYWFVIIAAAVTFVLLFLHHPFAMFASLSICLMLVLYCICYFVLQRKY